MALLNRWNSLGPRSKRTALLALLGAAGCTIFSAQPEEPKFAFSHRVHVADQGLSCSDCHTKVERDEEPGMPSAAQCALCHAQIDEQKPPEKKIAQLFEEKTFKARRFGLQSDEIVFSHQQHAARDSECASCHADVAASEAVTASMKIGMESCQKCHAAGKGPADCAGCHQQIRAEIAPASHDSNWERAHGKTMRAHNQDSRIARCDTCHTESSCTACHKAEAPENHTNYWRRRGHGLSASMDRRNCSACHEPESCDACHSQTRPMNHTGSWGSPQDRHCVTCHEPLRLEANCQVCHKDTPSHALATPMPAWHLPGMNCRQCHGNGQPLLHADNGATCISCHH